MRSFAERDGTTASRLFHDDLSYGHSFGQIDNKECALRDIESGLFAAAKLLDTAVTVVGPVAIVRSTMDYADD